jgi:hypothetical protein
MSVIPLDFQRRCEQRWAAKFLQPRPTPPRRQVETQRQEPSTSAEPTTITQRVKPAGSGAA